MKSEPPTLAQVNAQINVISKDYFENFTEQLCLISLISTECL